ncbi:MAG TPA: variant-type mycofactocin precursor [Syntrophorhabdaceae bacterium]|nr:variant-type mycofactocin precursor [Syntrophorhabdaceae bacterium]
MRKTQEKGQQEPDKGLHEENIEVPKDVLEEIEIEDLTVDGICGVY